MLRHDGLDSDRAIVLVIDLQVKLLPLIRHHERIVLCARKLIEGTRVFGVPVLVTEQYPKGLGATDSRLAPSLAMVQAAMVEKPTFSACGTDGVRQALLAADRTQVIITGVESHVCVQQSALDLRAMEYEVFVCADAVGSRGGLDHDAALQRMRQAGVHVTTVESVLFELCQRCDTDRFKAMLEVIKAYPPAERE